MSEDSYTEVTSESWFGRIGGAIKGILVGLVLLIAAFPLLFWNENRSVKRYRALKEGAGVVIPVDSGRVNPSDNMKLVHISGQAVTNETLTDREFGIALKAIKLARDVQMYQWRENKKTEEKKKLGGGKEKVTTYTYEKVWSANVIRSSGFKKRQGHDNPAAMPFNEQHYTAGNVTVGAFRLSSGLIGKISGARPLSMTEEDRMKLPDTIRSRAVVSNGEFYFGVNPQYPEIGDTRVAFEVVEPGPVSLVAQQTGKTFQPFQTKTGAIELLQTGIHSADAMFQTAQKENKFKTWVFRGLGFLLMFIGFSLMLKPLSVVLDVIPLLGNIAETGTGIIAFLMAAALSFVTIAVAWFTVRPLLSGGMIAVAVLFFAGIKLLPKKKTA